MPSKVRVVSYAINGRGMGHLVRQLAVLRMVRRLTALMDLRSEVWLLTSSEADTLARREGIPALKMPSKAMLRDAGLDPHRYLAVARTWVLNAVVGLQPDVLLVDTFPGGSFGELLPVLELAPQRVLVARRVRQEVAADDAYASLLPLYDDVIVPDDRDVGPILAREPAELMPRDVARRALGVPDGARAVYLTRGGGGDLDAARELPRLVRALLGAGWHVVVGAGPLYIGPELRGPGVTWLERYTPVELLTGVDAAVAASGYNTFHELMVAGVPTVFLPQPRLSDDQVARADLAVRAGAAVRARSLDEVAGLVESAGRPEAARSLVRGGGALRAAKRVLARVLPTARVDEAAARISDDFLARSAAQPGHERALLRLMTALSGAGVEGFLNRCEGLRVDPDLALDLVSALRRAFSAASQEATTGAALAWLEACAPFDDWMGALALLKAVPPQRTWDPGAFVAEAGAWLATETDLFEATARFSRLEGRGARTVPEVLHRLKSGG